MNSVDLRESGSYREARQGGVRSSPPPPPPPLSRLLSKYLRYRTRARANGMAKVQKTETRNSRARARSRDISGYRRARIHGRNDFSSRWKLVEKRGGLSRRKPRAGASRGELRAAVPLPSFPGRRNKRNERATLVLSQFERINSSWL